MWDLTPTPPNTVAVVSHLLKRSTENLYLKNWCLLREERDGRMKKGEKKGRGNASSSRDLPSWCPLQALEGHGQLHLPRAHCFPLGFWIRSWCTAFRTWSSISFIYGHMVCRGFAWFSWAAFCLPIAKSGSQAPFQSSEPYQSPPQCILGLCIFTFLALLSFLDQTLDRLVASVHRPLRNTSLFLRAFCAHPLSPV